MDRLSVRPLALANCPTTFGKLVILASLRNPATGVYREVGPATLKAEDADQALRSAHEEAFARWIAFSLEGQMEDLGKYFDTLPADPATIVKHWRTSRIYRGFVPDSAPESHKALFMSDLQTLLDLFGSRQRGKGASP